MRLFSLLLFCLSIARFSSAQSASEIPPVPREFRGAWVATVSNIDWPSRKNLSTQEQQRELVAILDLAAELNLNAIMLQIRPAADAFYPSAIEPWSVWLTGEQGRAPNPPWDPLAFAIGHAHARGLELHAWVNPFRAATSKGPFATNHISRTHPELVVSYGNYLWIDPTSEEAQRHVLRVIEDVLRRYDLDGIVFDDYFFPYPEAGVSFPDDGGYQRYRSGGGTLSHDDWRRDRVNTFVRRASELVHRTRPQARFGISPFGIWRPGHPAGIQGMDPYVQLYADSRLWLAEGWVDWLGPQLYWPIDKDAQSFPKLLEWWAQQNPRNRHVVAGTGLYRLGESSANAFDAKEVMDQLAIVRRTRGAHGEVHYRMKELMKDTLGVATRMKSGPYRFDALLPAATWLDDTPPRGPVVRFENNALSWQHPEPDDVRAWVVYARTGGKWWVEVVPAQRRSLPLGNGAQKPDLLAVTAVDRLGNESPHAIVRP